MFRQSLAQLGVLLRSRKLSSVELTRSLLARIERFNPRLNAFITVDGEKSLAQARAADLRIARGDGAPLTGIPIAHKDLFCARGWRTTCGSRMLADFVAPYDSHLIE
jgi:aspartyl-tRNA(Asn)/glutamyl-tRNA(Gln) amidotransferase subunit A